MADGFSQEQFDDLQSNIKATYGALDKKTDTLAEGVEILKKRLDEKADATDLQDRVSGLKDDVEKLSKTADQLDAKLARPWSVGAPPNADLGAELKAAFDPHADTLKDMAERPGRATVEMKDILLANALSSDTGQNVLGPPTRRPGLIDAPHQNLRIRSLIPTVRVSTTSVTIVKETGFTNAAAPVPEAGMAPLSNLTYDDETLSVKAIAHHFRLSREALDDMPQILGRVQYQGLYGMALVEERQIMFGDGTGDNLTGLIPQAPAYDAAGIPTGADAVDQLRWAKLQVRKALYPASGVVLNPTDWAKIMLRKDANGAYLSGAFASDVEPRLWGLRVVESDSMPEGQFLVGAFNLGATIYDRMRPSVIISTEDRDNVVTRRATVMMSERLALGVERPESFVYGGLI